MANLDQYEVGVRGHTTRMQLSAEEAQAFKDEGVHCKKVGSVEPAQRQDVTAPPYAVDEDGKDLPKTAPGVRQRSRQPKNK